MKKFPNERRAYESVDDYREPDLGYISKFDRKKVSGSNGLIEPMAMMMIIIINVYLSRSTQEYKDVTIKKMIHSKCKQ